MRRGGEHEAAFASILSAERQPGNRPWAKKGRNSGFFVRRSRLAFHLLAFSSNPCNAAAWTLSTGLMDPAPNICDPFHVLENSRAWM